MKILVTGGAGFIGSHLCESLVAAGHAVTCLDNFFTGRKSNVAHLLDRPGFRLVEHDVVVPFEADVERIYNLACPASPVHYQADPVRTMLTNVQGALNMLQLAERTQARVLQASTSEVYGDPEVHPQVETYWGNVNCTGPRACYDEGKRAAETLFFDCQRSRGVAIRVARIFNTYGPRMLANDGRVVSNFVVQALRGEPVTIYGDGSQTRSFCYVDDLVAGLMRLMESDVTDAPVNLGNPEEYTVKALAHKIVAMTGSASKTVHKPIPQDDPRRRRPDISVAETRLGWRPSTRVDAGLAKTIAYFRAAPHE